nr:reverse transcriptase domain-containing protein [Tanacetum cinerariifolium]
MRTRNFYFPNNSFVTIPRRQNKRRAPNVVEPEFRAIVEVAPIADNQTMEELLQAPKKGYGKAIVIPEINADHFEIKTNLLQFVQANPYHGFERENSHAHINNLKRITSTLKFRDVPNDLIKLMMFLYSLEGSVRTFGEAWERFKEMLRACLHHRFTELTQIDTFYNGLNKNDQDSLNAAAGENLLSKTTREALQIIENKSKVRYSRNKPNVSRINTTYRENATDRSITRPKGVAEDVFVKVGKFHFPTDFVVVDFEADPRVSLILGRSFLRIGRVLIDVYGEEITLRVNDEAVTFNLNQTMRYSSTYDDMSGSDFILEKIKAYLKDETISLEIDHADCDLEGDICLIETLLNDNLFQLPSMDLKQKEVIKAKSLSEEPPELELKDLPSHLEYAYLEDGFFGYFQIPISPPDQENTTFTCPYGTFAYRRMPFGLCNAPRTFQSKQDAKLRLLRWVLLLHEFDITIRDKKGSENIMVDHLSRLENHYKDVLENKAINENFPLKTLGILSNGSTPWFADIANFHAGNFIKKGLTSQQKKKFFKDVKHYSCDVPYLF